MKESLLARQRVPNLQEEIEAELRNSVLAYAQVCVGNERLFVARVERR